MPSQPTMPLVAVTGSQRPYIFDLPQLLSLPDGFEYRFRYDRVWVADELRHELDQLRAGEANPSERLLAGQALFVVFHSQERKALLPVRCCTVIGVELLGPMVFVRFRVGPLVRVSAEVMSATGDGLRTAERTALRKMGIQLVGLAGHDLSQRLPEGSYLRRSAVQVPDDTWLQIAPGRVEEATRAWASVAALLQDEPQLNRVPLFRLIGFQRKDGGYREPENISRSFTVSTEKTKGFKLVEGERYRLRLLEWCETMKGGGSGAEASATVPRELLSLEGASNLVVGKYDVLEFACMARTPGYGELAIRVEAPREDGQAASQPGDVRQPTSGINPSEPWPFFYVARVPICVRQSRLRLALLATVGVAGIALYLWAPAIPLGVLGLRLPGGLAQLAGIAMMFAALGEYLQRFVKFSSGLKDLPVAGGLRTTA